MTEEEFQKIVERRNLIGKPEYGKPMNPDDWDWLTHAWEDMGVLIEEVLHLRGALQNCIYNRDVAFNLLKEATNISGRGSNMSSQQMEKAVDDAWERAK